ncbi:hypothetical protein KKF61_06770 [Patescibacteria group bacterium]|nr:hypothetical protein [Patescibacteria group bacterium]
MPNNSTITETKTKVNIYQKISVAIMMLSGVIVAGAFIIGVLSSTEKKEATPTQTTLTQRLLAKNSEYQRATAQNKESVKNTMIEISANRKTALEEKIINNDESIFDDILTSPQADSLPDFLDDYIETPATFDGTIEFLTIDDFIKPKSFSKTNIYYHDANGQGKRQIISFLGNYGFNDQDQVNSQGFLLNGIFYTAEKTSTIIRATTSEDTIGEQKTLVIMAKFDKRTFPAGQNAVYAENYYFNNEDSVNEIYQEYSYDKAYLSGDVFGPADFNQPDPPCDWDASLALVNNPALNSVDWITDDQQNYERVVFVVPGTGLLCGNDMYGGRSSVGKIPLNTHEGEITTSLTMVYTGFYSNYKYVHFHELGHAFGLWHSTKLQCWPRETYPDFDDLEECYAYEYGDIYSIMGNTYSTGLPHMSASQKEKLGWLEDSEITTINTAGMHEVTIGNYEDPATLTKAVKIHRESLSGDNKQWLYIERRQAIGTDSIIDGGNEGHITDGVLVHYNNCDWVVCSSMLQPNKSHLIMANPDNYINIPINPAMHLNESILDEPNTWYGVTGGIGLQTTNVTDDDITIKITYGEIEKRDPVHDGSIMGWGSPYPPVYWIDEFSDQLTVSTINPIFEYDKAFLKFNLSGIDLSTVVAAQLRLYAFEQIEQEEEKTIDIYSMDDYGTLEYDDDDNPDEWEFIDHIYNHRPWAYHTYIDVTQYINKLNPTFMLKANVPEDVFSYIKHFASSEHADPDLRPQLLLTVIPAGNSTCSDSDGDNHLTAGTCTDALGTYADVCGDDDTIEAVCSDEYDGFCEYTSYNCAGCTDGICDEIEACSDGTPWGECNSGQRYCDNGTLIAECGLCGVTCPEGYTCQDLECCKKVGGSWECSPILLPNSFAL